MKRLLTLSLCFFSFSNLHAEWLNPGIVSPFNSDVSNGMDESGNTTLIWAEWVAKTNHIYSSTLPKADNSYWLGVETVFAKEDRIFYYTTVAVDAAGDAVAIWQETDSERKRKISASISRIRGRWSTPIDLTDTGAGQGLSPQIAMAPFGFTVAIWRLDSQVQVATLQFGDTWSKPINLGSSEDAPQIKVDASGNVVAAWVDNGAIQVATLPFGGTWSTPTTLASGHLFAPQLAMNAKGHVFVSWAEMFDSTNTYSINAAGMQFGKNWAKPVCIGKGDLISNYCLAIDPNGHAMVIWMQQDLDSTSPFPTLSVPYLQATYFTNKHWSMPTTISAKTDGAYNPNLAMDGSGNVYAIWNNYSTVQTSLFSPSSTHWSEPEVLRSGPYGLITKPKISVHASGYAVANWCNELGSIESAKWVPDMAH